MAIMWFSFLEDLEIHRFVVVCIGNDIFNNNCGVYRYAHKQTYIHTRTVSKKVHKTDIVMHII